LLYILSGEDEFSVHQALEEIKKGLGDRDMLSANTTILDGGQLNADNLRPVCATVPFLAEKRLVVVKGLLGRFEPKAGGGGRQKAAAKTSRRDECQAFADCLMEMPESTVVVLVDGKVGGANPLRKALAGKATVKNYPRLRKPELREWINKRVKQGGGDISPPAVDLLVSHVGGNLWAMSSEIEKLLLFASGRRIETEDVEKIVSHAREVSVFAMVDAILEFRVRAAEQALHSLLQRGAAPGYLMAMLVRQVRMIVLAKEMRGNRVADADMQKRLGLANEYAFRKTLEQAGGHSMERMKRLYRCLLETDLSIKTGKYDSELALTMLVAELCHRG